MINDSQLSIPYNTQFSPPIIFRPIHYLGSKLRILDFIQDAIGDVDPSGGSVCDLFSGSGSLAYKLSATRNVTAVDIQEYSRVICSALLNPPSYSGDITSYLDAARNSEHKCTLEWAIEPLANLETVCMERSFSGDLEPLCELIEKGSIIAFELGYTQKCSSDLSLALKSTISRLDSANLIKGPETLTVRYFGGLYFSYTQAAHIDALLESAASLRKEYKDSFIAAILSTASDAVNTVGKQFAQPIRPRKSDGTPKNNLGQMANKDRGMDIFKVHESWIKRYLSLCGSGYDHSIYRMDYSDALDILTNDIKVVYADPPYTRDHYSRFYHLFETLCLRDNPAVSTTLIRGNTTISRGVYREDRHQSPFCIKSQAQGAFENLFAKVRNIESSLLLSYSPYDSNKKARPRLLTIEQLEAMAKKYFKRVETISPGNFSHSKLNRSEKHLEASTNAELLIVCQAD